MIPIRDYFTDEHREIIPDLLEKLIQGKQPILSHLISVEKHRFDTKNYAPPVIKELLQSFFHGKCAFCEDYMGNYILKVDEKHDFDWQVEHFRPKALYKWLGYECTNFLVSCPICNNKKHKGDNFPIEGEPANIQDFLTDKGLLDWTKCNTKDNAFLNAEKPLLLNPVFDTALYRHFKFQNDGEIKGQTPQGIKSIDIYGLNRKQLRIRRKEIIDKIRVAVSNDIVIVIGETRGISEKALFNVLSTALKTLAVEIQNKESTFTALRVAILANFDEFIINNDNPFEPKKGKFEMPKRGELLAIYTKMKHP